MRLICRRTMNISPHAIGTARLRIGRLPSIRWRAATNRTPIARIVGNIVRSGRHRRGCNGGTAWRRHTRGLTLSKRAGERSSRQRSRRVTRAQSDTQSLELMTTQCCCQRRRLHRMLATTGGWLIADGAGGSGRPAAARMVSFSSVAA